MSEENRGVFQNLAQFLGAHEDGALNDDLTKDLHALIAEIHNIVLEQGGNPSGDININLKFTLDSGMIEVKAKTDIKMPKLIRKKSSYYATKENRLTINNPRQPNLPFRDITAGIGETAQSTAG